MMSRASWPSCASRHSISRCTGISLNSPARFTLASTSTTPVSAKSRLTSVRAGWPRMRMRQSPGSSCQKDRSVLTNESGSFSEPLLKLMREFVASRYGNGVALRLLPGSLPAACCVPPLALVPAGAAAVRKSVSRFQRPTSVRTRFKLASSTLMRLISNFPRQRERMRKEAVTVLACSTGSAP